MFSRISSVLICKRLILIKNHILEVCAIALKWVSVIQISFMPFNLSKVWYLINTKGVWQNSKITDIIFCQNYENVSKYQILSTLWNFDKNENFFKICHIKFTKNYAIYKNFAILEKTYQLYKNYAIL
jgi:hypothetical protein